jgi:hypothetical protein
MPMVISTKNLLPQDTACGIFPRREQNPADPLHNLDLAKPPSLPFVMEVTNSFKP